MIELTATNTCTFKSRNPANGRVIRFHFSVMLGVKPQTVLWHGKAKQQHIALEWKWNYGKSLGRAPDFASLTWYQRP